MNEKVNKYSSELVWADLGTSGTDEVRFKKVGSGTGNFTLALTYNNKVDPLRYLSIFDLYGNLLFRRDGQSRELIFDGLSFSTGDTMVNDAFVRNSCFYFCNLSYPAVLYTTKVWNGFYGCDIRIRNGKPTLYTISISYDEPNKKITCTYCKCITFESSGTYTIADFNILQIYH